MRRRPRARRGFTFLETEVAFVLLGIGLSGLLPLIVMQIRLAKKVERGINPQTGYFKPGTTAYLVPSADKWARKLGVAASIAGSADASADPSGGSSTPSAYIASIVGPVERSLDSETIVVHVQITARPSGPSP